MSISSPHSLMELPDNMDDNKRTVLVAALSAYAELLAKNTQQLDLEQGKGKHKAGDEDVDLDQEVKNQIAICGELVKTVTAAPALADVNEEQESEDSSWGSGWGSGWATAKPKERARIGKEKGKQHQLIEIDEEEELLDPFTGRPITAETGYEAGPSDRPPAPLRQTPKTPQNSSHPLELFHNSFYAPSTKPLPRRPMEYEWEPATSSTTASNQYQDSDLFNPSSWAPEPLRSQRDLFNTENASQTGLARMSSTKRKDVSVNHIQDTKPQHKYIAYSPPTGDAGDIPYSLAYEEPTKDIPNVEWEAKYRDVDDEFQTRTSSRGSYMRHLTGFASKALKSAGSMMNLGRSPSTRHLSSTHQISSPEIDHIPEKTVPYTFVVELPAGNESNIEMRKAKSRGPPQPNPLPQICRKLSSISINASRSLREVEKERHSPVGRYETPQDIGRQPTWRSQASHLHKSSWSNSSFTDNSILTATSPNPSSPSDSTTETLSPLSSNDDSQYELDSEDLVWLPRSASSATKEERWSPGSKRGWRASRLADGNMFARMSTQPKEKRAEDLVSSTTNLTDEVRNLDIYGAAFGQELESRVSLPSARSIFDADDDYPRKGWSVNEVPMTDFGSNNPWRDNTMADEALAKSLQQEEYRTQQMERDLLLAYALADGTAEDGDVELAYYLARETASLISATEPSNRPETKPGELYTSFPTSATTKGKEKERPFDILSRMKANGLYSTSETTSPTLKGKEKENPFAQLDSLRKAQELERQFLAQISEEDASLAVAQQLQDSFDMEANNDDAWQEWKQSNIDECIVCGDEQHRDELLRPCEHGYCEECLQDGFKRALASKTVLKCCKPLDVEDCTGLTSQFITEYREMVLELTTQSPLYCNVAKCGSFLPPRTITGDVGTCTKCKAQTCKHCTKRHHPGTFCKEDTETNAVRDLAKAKGWKSCPGCNHLIERQSGCLHMVCSRCQTAFCYRCEKKWKDCESTCPDAISATHPKV